MNQYVDFPEALPGLLLLLMESLLPMLVNFLSVEEMVNDVALRIVFHTLLIPRTFTLSEFLPLPSAAGLVVATWGLPDPALWVLANLAALCGLLELGFE